MNLKQKRSPKFETNSDEELRKNFDDNRILESAEIQRFNLEDKQKHSSGNVQTPSTIFTVAVHGRGGAVKFREKERGPPKRVGQALFLLFCFHCIVLVVHVGQSGDGGYAGDRAS